MYKDLLSKKFGIYFARWQISAWIMLPVMLVLESFLPLWLNLMVGQAVGAFIFWEIDKYIFHNHKTDNMEDALTKSGGLNPEVSSRKL
jgi:hypothetical protein